MILIACLDDAGGMMFGKRRQSKDRLLREHLLSVCEGRTLWMSPYSASQFEPDAPVCADADYTGKLSDEDACFVEDGAFPDVPPSTLLLYRWNRRYPADRFFPFDPLERGYRLVSSQEFVGSSHECITVDRYERNDAHAL